MMLQAKLMENYEEMALNESLPGMHYSSNSTKTRSENIMSFNDFFCAYLCLPCTPISEFAQNTCQTG